MKDPQEIARKIRMDLGNAERWTLDSDKGIAVIAAAIQARDEERDRAELEMFGALGPKQFLDEEITPLWKLVTQIVWDHNPAIVVGLGGEYTKALKQAWEEREKVHQAKIEEAKCITDRVVTELEAELDALRKEREEILGLIRHYFSQMDRTNTYIGHIPHQFKKFVGCRRCGEGPDVH